MRANSEVVRVHTACGKAAGVTLASGETLSASKAVIANAHPWQLGELIEGMDEGVAARASATRLSSFGAVNTHWALKEAPKYKAGPVVNSAAVVEPAPSTMLRFRQHFDQMRYGQIPDSINASVQHNSNYDRTRVPNGEGASLYLYHFVPLKLTGKELSYWDEVKEDVKEDVLRRYSPRTSNSTWFQLTPIPKRSRPSLKTSIWAACLAASAVCRCGRIITPETNSTRSVVAATNAMVVVNSWKNDSCV